jgi:exonuclease VII small subunit
MEASELDQIIERLESLARELDAEPEEERAAELVREASELAAQAGREVDRALRGASEVRDPPEPSGTP